jgi:phosphoribosylamine--glycine ligase
VIEGPGGGSSMKVLVIGGGGREHALVWALGRSTRVSEVVCAPGNAGIAALARCVALDVTDVDATIALAMEEMPGLVVIGPEVPLSLGVVDALQARGLRVFGPTRAAAQLETSKAFAKELMRRNEIATPAYAVCRTPSEVAEALRAFGVPVVVKADGLAAGKGVVICQTHEAAAAAAAQMFSGDLLGAEVSEVLVEEFLEGEELSFFALCDGATAVPIAAAQDHKRVGEGDTGPNTGGMGAYSTDALMGPEMSAWLTGHVAQRVVDGMREQGMEFRGVLFCGMMMVLNEDGAVRPMVLEFNTRFGDPETEALMLRLETDVLDLLEASVDGTAGSLDVRLRPGASACVVAASGGYPGGYASGKVISGLGDVSGDVVVFHCGTVERDGAVVTSGGRVLGVTAASELGLEDALARVYGAMKGIGFEGMQYRRDIGWRALREAR